MYNLTEYFLYFMIYAFFGYIAEVVYVAICTKKITNRGFLYGPFVPIYGFGAIGIILSLSWAYNLNTWYSPIVVFVLGFLLTTLLEYFVSWGMEMIFHMRWWDYSDKFLNINGRVCLRNSTMFGILVVLVMYLLHPYAVIPFISLIESLGDMWFYFISLIIFILIMTDATFSTIKQVNISKIIKKLENMYLEMQKSINDAKEEASKKMESLKEYLASTRVVRSFKALERQYSTAKIKTRTNHLRLSLKEFINKVKDKFQGE